LIKRLILGYATNAPAEAIYPFVVSARRWHRPDDTRIALFVTPDGAEAGAVHALANEFGIELLPATSQWRGPRSRWAKIAARGALAWWKAWDRLDQVRQVENPSGTGNSVRYSQDRSREIALGSWCHPHYTRWLDYLRMLETNRGIGEVFLSDVTDVIFQRNIFERLDPQRLSIAQQPLVYDGHNVDSGWLRDALGPNRLEALMGQPVMCVGTVGGPIGPMIQLCQTLWNTFAQRPFGGVEQAYFNDLFYCGALGSCAVRSNDEGFVLTITSPQECPRLTAGPNGLRYAGSVPAAVHMYNRLPEQWRASIDAVINGQCKFPGSLESHSDALAQRT